jgi:hypothetical protein
MLQTDMPCCWIRMFPKYCLVRLPTVSNMYSIRGCWSDLQLWVQRSWFRFESSFQISPNVRELNVFICMTFLLQSFGWRGPRLHPGPGEERVCLLPLASRDGPDGWLVGPATATSSTKYMAIRLYSTIFHQARRYYGRRSHCDILGYDTCNFVSSYRRFGGTCCLSIHGTLKCLCILPKHIVS